MFEIDYFDEANKKFFIKSSNNRLYSYEMLKSNDNEKIKSFKNEEDISIEFEEKNKNYKTIFFKKGRQILKNFAYFEPPIQIKCIDINYTIYTFYQGEKILNKYPAYVFTTEKGEKIIQVRELSNYTGKIIYINKITESTIIESKINFDKQKITINDLSVELLDKKLIDNQFFLTDKRKELLEEINSFVDKSNEKYIYYYGKHGIGKTYTLLYFRYFFNGYCFYFNCKQLFFDGSNYFSIGNYIKNELLYAFRNEKEANDFTKEFLDLNSLKEEFQKDNINFRLNLMKKIIYAIKNYNTYGDKKIILIFDQFKEKFDGNLNKLSLEIQNLAEQNYFKYIQCSSINEDEIRNSIEYDLFEEAVNVNKKKYKCISELVTIEKLFENRYQNLIFHEFGRLPLFYENILNLQESSISIFLEEKKKFYFNILEKFIKNNIKYESLFLTALISIYDIIGKEINKEKLKKIFNSVPVKLVKITKKRVDTGKNEEKKYILNYIFPFIKKVYYAYIKERKINCYYDYLFDANGNEEGYVLERLVYFAFDKGEKPFQDKGAIEESYEIDQVKYISKIILDLDILLQISTLYYHSKNGETYIKLLNDDDEADFIKKLIKNGKLYNFKQKNSKGESYDGALLIPISNKRNFELILYQITKDKTKKNKVTRNTLLEDKHEIINLFQNIFNIKISKFSFVYILLENEKETNLIKFCKQPYNNLSYIFFSLNNRKLYPSNKLKSDILNLKDIYNREILETSSISDLVFNRFKPDNYENSNKILDVIISNNCAFNKNYNLLTKKRGPPTNEEDIKTTNDYNNFCLLKSHCGNSIIPKKIDEKDIANYFREKKKKKNNYINKIKENYKKINKIIIPECEYELEEPSELEINAFKGMKFTSKEEDNILNFISKKNIKIKIFKRMYIDFPKSIPKYPLFITIYDKNTKEKYMFYDEDINENTTTKIKFNITSNQNINLELYCKIIDDSFKYSFRDKYSTYLCGFFFDEDVNDYLI